MSLSCVASFRSFLTQVLPLARALRLRTPRWHVLFSRVSFTHKSVSPSIATRSRSYNLWLVRYVYVPLGGNRGSAIRRIVVVVAVFAFVVFTVSHALNQQCSYVHVTFLSAVL
jgi:hypothetical protein